MNNKQIEIEKQNWYESHKNKLGHKLAIILSEYKYKRDWDNSWICNPIKHVISNPTSITAVCLELGGISINELRIELGYK